MAVAMTASMGIELVGGPADGVRVDVPEYTVVWVVAQPAMTPAEFIAAEERPDLIEFATMKVRQHAYQKTQRRAFSGCWVFVYAGERAEQ